MPLRDGRAPCEVRASPEPLTVALVCEPNHLHGKKLPMQNGIHFISGLPRSGSTLLAAILRQNPSFHAGITSPVGALLRSMLESISQGNESAVLMDDEQRLALLRGIFDNYYHAIHPERVVFDTNRAWTTRIELLATLFPNAKMICCVRHIPWVIDSIERLIRKNELELSKIFSFDSGGTVYSRADGLMSSNGMIGFALTALKQAMHSAESNRMLLLPYDLLVARPQAALDDVYAFTGLPPFRHDFDNVSYREPEFDARLGTPGLHDIRPVVGVAERETILPPDLWHNFEGASIWRDPKFNSKSVRIAGM
jgi:sulfotransferase